MDKKFIPFLAILILFASPVFAVTVQMNAINDTYTPAGNIIPYGSLPLINLTQGESFFKFNITNATSHLFSAITLRLDPTAGFCATIGGCYFEIKYLNNNSWDESLIGTSRPDGTRTLISAIPLSTTGGNKDSLDFFGLNTPWAGGLTRTAFNQSIVINGFYMNNTLSLFINGTTFYTPGALGSGNMNGSIVTINTGFSNNYPQLNFTIVEFLNGTHSDTDLTSFAQLDFETGADSDGVNLPSMDIDYNPTLNALVPNSVTGVTMAFGSTSTTIDNDLATRILECYTITSYNSNVHNPNIIPGTYSYICVNLSSTHQGKPFFGMIKVINNTNVRGNSSPEWDFYFAVASPNYVVFSAPTYVPSPPQIGLNLTITTATSITMHNGVMYFRFNTSSGFSPWGTVGAETGVSFTAIHEFILNNQFLNSSRNFEIYFTADDGALNYTSGTYIFNVSLPINNVVNGSALPNALSGLVAAGIVPDYNSALGLFSAFIIVGGTAISFYYAGAIVSIITAVALITVLSLMGFLPYYLMIPILLVAAGIVVSWVSGIFKPGRYA